MGIFNLLVNLLQPGPKSKNSKKEYPNSLPTIKPDKDLYVCYDKVFFEEMKNVDGFSANEVKDIHSIIKQGDGFLNRSGNHKEIYENFFKNRNWIWREYEEWNDICTKMGKYPSSFPIKKTVLNNDINLEFILNTLKVDELKEILKTEKIDYQEKSKKMELINIVKKISNVKSTKLVIDKVKEIKNKESYELYELLLRTIQFRATNLHNEKRANAIGVKIYKIDVIYDEDKVFVNLALAKNPNAIPPFFPSDLTMKTPIIKF